MAASGQNTGAERICPTCHESFDGDAEVCPADGSKLIKVGQNAEDRIGQKIEDKYEIKALLGAGGMGGVYRAYQTSMDREVAIKLIHRSFSDDGTAVRRFLQEAKGASRLNHPNIITLFEFGQTKDRELYLVMELLEGDTLEKLVRRTGAMDPKRVVAMGSQICDALQHAHDNDLIHRDLKPDNIMVLSGAGRHGEFVKVLDFGIAKVRSVEGAESLTRTGMVCGTPSYMSPEQARDQPLDHRSDIYSIGVVLYEMLSGALPFTGGTPIDMLMAHVSKAPRSLREAFPELDIPQRLDEVVLSCLAKAPEDRPTDTE
ncbi:MAG: serine/threonine-protein kinase, partial [Myxococcota bacterium]|nr:serine/threonine-protein kinase [Myxococcota bacterium]